MLYFSFFSPSFTPRSSHVFTSISLVFLLLSGPESLDWTGSASHLKGNILSSSLSCSICNTKIPSQLFLFSTPRTYNVPRYRCFLAFSPFCLHVLGLVPSQLPSLKKQKTKTKTHHMTLAQIQLRSFSQPPQPTTYFLQISKCI